VQILRILVDAGAYPVKNIINKVARAYSIPVIMFIGTSQRESERYPGAAIAEKQRDSVELTLLSEASVKDIVITQDYGLAILAIGKGAKALNQDGFIYSIDNIDRLIFEHHLSQKISQSRGVMSGLKRRNREDDIRLENALVNLIETEKNIEDKV